MTMISLRAPEIEDLDFLYTLENDPQAAEAAFTTAPMSRFMLRSYLENYDADFFAAKQLRLIITDSQTSAKVGCVDISDYIPRDRRAFVGIAIAPQYRGRGYAKAALTQICQYASSVLGLHQLAAQISIDNSASIHIFKQQGFKPCGKLRSWIRHGNSYTDALIFQKLF